LRVRPTSNYYWFVRLRHRGKHRRITLGKTTDLDAALAEGMQSVVAMNGMQDANAAAGMNQGQAGGINAPTPGAPGVGPTGPMPTMM
jgi:hypothetical protein